MAIVFYIALTLLVLIAIRCFYLMYEVYHLRRPKCHSKSPSSNVKTAIVMGSGGHTSEMLRIIENIDNDKYKPRLYIVAMSDINSEVKIMAHEQRHHPDQYRLIKIPRSREVNQSYLTSLFTTLFAILATLPKMLYHRPELILCNGPGTCIPICLVAFLLRALWVSDNRIVFIESICRVKTLSLSGKILLFFADAVFVQWPDLQKLYPRTHFVGNL